MNYILFDDYREDLLPLTFTRPVCDLRIGVMTIREKWEKRLNAQTSTFTEKYLSAKFPCVESQVNVLINGGVCPTKQLVEQVSKLKPGEQLVKNGKLLAACSNDSLADFDFANICGVELNEDVTTVEHPWDIFSKNGNELKEDFTLLTNGRTSASLSDSVTVIGDGVVFLEEGAKAEACIFNTSNGPIYLG